MMYALIITHYLRDVLQRAPRFAVLFVCISNLITNIKNKRN